MLLVVLQATGVIKTQFANFLLQKIKNKKNGQKQFHHRITTTYLFVKNFLVKMILLDFGNLVVNLHYLLR